MTAPTSEGERAPLGRKSEADDEYAQRLAWRIVQDMADSEPDDDTIEAQELLEGTPQESICCLTSAALQSAICCGISNALYDREIMRAEPVGARTPKGAPMSDERELVAKELHAMWKLGHDNQVMSGGYRLAADWGSCVPRSFYAAADRILSALTSPRGSEWRDIATAPRDGTRVLVASGPRVREAWWRTPWNGAPMSSCYWSHGDDLVLLDDSVHRRGATHWMPLPAQPTTQEEPPA